MPLPMVKKPLPGVFFCSTPKRRLSSLSSWGRLSLRGRLRKKRSAPQSHNVCGTCVHVVIVIYDECPPIVWCNSCLHPSLPAQLKEERQNLTAKNEALQAELDFTRNQLTAKKTQVCSICDISLCGDIYPCVVFMLGWRVTWWTGWITTEIADWAAQEEWRAGVCELTRWERKKGSERDEEMDYRLSPSYRWFISYRGTGYKWAHSGVPLTSHRVPLSSLHLVPHRYNVYACMPLVK